MLHSFRPPCDVIRLDPAWQIHPSKVWAPIIVVGDLVVPFTLQRMSELLASTAPVDVKMKEAQKLCDGMAAHAVEPDARNKSMKKMWRPHVLANCILQNTML